MAEVPRQAISMSIKQILKSRNILCIVPDDRKAEAVRASVTLTVSPERPASILQQHERVTLYLDHHSASLLVSDDARGSGPRPILHRV
jgi:glucosamine-6-phosphate deaminase